MHHIDMQKRHIILLTGCVAVTFAVVLILLLATRASRRPAEGARSAPKEIPTVSEMPEAVNSGPRVYRLWENRDESRRRYQVDSLFSKAGEQIREQEQENGAPWERLALVKVSSDGTVSRYAEKDVDSVFRGMATGIRVLVIAFLVLAGILLAGLILKATGWLVDVVAGCFVRARKRKGKEEAAERAEAYRGATMEALFTEMQAVQDSVTQLCEEFRRKEEGRGFSVSARGEAVPDLPGDYAVEAEGPDFMPTGPSEEEEREVNEIIQRQHHWTMSPFRDESMPWNEAIRPLYTSPHFEGKVCARFVSADGRFILVGCTPMEPAFKDSVLRIVNREAYPGDFWKGIPAHEEVFERRDYSFNFMGTEFELVFDRESRMDGTAGDAMLDIQRIIRDAIESRPI